MHQLENVGCENSKCLIVPLHAIACDDNDRLNVKLSASSVTSCKDSIIKEKLK